jgi:DNA-binding CsgD family transcriptional regulator
MRQQHIEGRNGPGLTGRRQECGALDGLIEAVQGGESRSLVVLGEPGVGKSALLEYAARRATGCRVTRAAGVQSEMELAFAGLHQLLAPLMDRINGLPAPQRDALGAVFGLSGGPAPERFLVALAVLSLLSDAADERPLLCVVDDEQWLDRASAQALAFVARRLHVESVGLVVAAREATDDWAGVSQLRVDGLREHDARALLESVVTGPLDPRIRDRVVNETGGNPLALLELARGLTPAERAGGFGLSAGMTPLSGRIEESFRRRLDALPAQTRLLMQLAAADPVGEPLLVWRAAERLGIPPQAAGPAAEAELLEFGTRVDFRHPLVRSAAYRSASLAERQEVHRALAEVTDPDIDPDRRAWHRAQAAAGPDEDVAEELERSAGRAQARGGLAAAAAFLERSATLTRKRGLRGQRLLAAARAKREAGALDAAQGLLAAVEGGPVEPRRTAELDQVRGQIAFDQRRYADAARLLLSAANHLETIDPTSAREALFEALLTAIWGGGLEDASRVREVAEAARAAPPAPDPPRAVDLLLDGFAARLTDGYAAAATTLAGALEMFVGLQVGADEVGGWLWRAGSRASGVVALELWDYDSWHALAAEQVRFARGTGALVHLQSALNFLGWTHVVAGEMTAAARLMEESHLIAEATEYSPIGYTAMTFAAWSGAEARASELIQSTSQDMTAADLQTVPAACASALLYNGLCRHDAARDAAWTAFQGDPVGYGTLVIAELAEAASRTGDADLVQAAVDRVSERTGATPTEWSLGMEARIRAVASESAAADALYRASIDHLGRTRLKAELARSHLLYGEWLRREGRRVDAREHLRTAHEMLTAMGIDGFAERAGRELMATGETARKRTVETRDELTPQEAHIARLARDGLSNPEIGARLFISPRTVKYHLSKIFTKLEITSRSQLEHVLPPEPATAASA